MDPNDPLNQPDEILRRCIRDGNHQMLTRLLASHRHIFEHCSLEALLLVATQLNNVQACRMILNARAHTLFSAENETEISSAIMLATQLGHREIVKLFWNSFRPRKPGSGLLCWDEYFEVAAMHGHVKLVDDFLVLGNGWSFPAARVSLCLAAGKWEDEIVELLLSEIWYNTENLNDALHEALTLSPQALASDFEERYGTCWSRYSPEDRVKRGRVVRLLLDAGADPNYDWKYLDHPVHLAARFVNLEGELKMLLEKGANLNARNVSGQTALHHLASPVRIEEGSKRRRQLHQVGIQLLLEHGADCAISDSTGETPLHAAAFGADLPTFKLLFFECTEEERSIKSFGGQTLLHFAAAGGKLDILNFILHHLQDLQDINTATCNGWTPLLCALCPAEGKPTSDAIKAACDLLIFGANPNVTSKEGWTPLHGLAALSRGHGPAARVARLLIERGTGVDDFSINAGATLFETYQTEGLYPLVGMRFGARKERLWGYGLALAIKYMTGNSASTIKKGRTPLHLAVETGNVAVLQVLLENGADVTVKDSDGFTPAKFAAVLDSEVRCEILRLFEEAWQRRREAALD